MIDNRRNFYRILRVQPDASREVIQQSYRSLMQKLQLHPDLGGEQWDASLVNQAYSVLRDAVKRARYDAELLERYNIKVLSAGGVAGVHNKDGENAAQAQAENNQRNYYRVLHVQPDAEIEVINASYRALCKSLSGKQRALLDEAFNVLRDPHRRAKYDTLISSHSHASSADKLDDRQRLPVATQQGDNEDIDNTQLALGSAYQSPIAHFCAFCKTPYTKTDLMESTLHCEECDSPLTSPADDFVNAPRRSLARMQQSETASFYEFWPARPTQVTLEDLSPTGLNFCTSQLLDVDQIIKLDGSTFKAVGQVVYCKPDGALNSIGIRFVTVDFFRSTGSFFSTSV